METTQTAEKKVDLQLFDGSILESIMNISNADIGVAREGLSNNDTRLPGEIFIGKMNQLEIKTFTFIIAAKKQLETEVRKNGSLSGNELAVNEKIVSKLSRDITFAKIMLKYLVKDRFSLPREVELNFKKDFQITCHYIEHRGEED